MRKTDRDMEFKGSIFTELETQEQADLLLENKELKIDGEELMLVMKRSVLCIFITFFGTISVSYTHLTLPTILLV